MVPRDHPLPTVSQIRPKHKTSIEQRCADDEMTRLMRKYQLFYLEFERQRGARFWHQDREMIMMTSNEYLGLSHHPKVVAAGKRAIDEWGSGTTGARTANGSRTYHSRLEHKLAEFLGKEACIVSAAGYLSCMAAVSTFAGKGDLIVVDRNVHSSLWTGIQLTGARVERFAHNNPDDLKELLAHENPAHPKLMVVEGIYSMEGHIVRLPELNAIIEGHNCFTVVDDAHGFGILGDQGNGTVASFGLTDSVEVICGSLSKSLSSTGGFIAASKEIVDFIKANSKQTIFSAAISPSQAACAEAALQVMVDEPEHRERLWENTRYYLKILHDLELDTWDTTTPAVPIVLGDKQRAYRAWKKLFDLGVFTVLAVSPSVPPGKDLLRTAVSARHTHDDLDQVGDALAKATRWL